MLKFDIGQMDASGHEQREKNVFYETREFKMRVIDLAPGQGLPRCEMVSHVIFVCVRGQAEVIVGNERTTISRGQCLVTGPTSISMSTASGARLLGIQVTPGSTE